MIAVIAAACIALDVHDFFPMAPGTKWTYETIAGSASEASTTTVLPAVKVGEEDAFPFRTSVQGKSVGTAYHRIVDDTVYIVAFAASRPLDIPRPIFRYAEGGSKWTVQTIEDGEALVLKNETTFKGEQTVLDKTVEVIELRTDATLGERDRAIEFSQVARYAKGIGLVEMTTERREKKQVLKKRLNLVSFKAPEGGS